MSSDNGLSRL